MVDLDVGVGVFVALHGHGDSPGSARAWARAMAPAGWEVVAPGAPERDGVRSWFSSGPRGADTEQLRTAVGRVGDIVDRVRAGGRPVVVAGFSQGGAVALALGCVGVEPDAVVSVCGFWAESDLELVPAAASTAPVLVLNGAQDDVVPAVLGQDAAASLEAAGHDVTSAVLPIAHEVGPAALDAAHEWVVERFRSGPRISVGLPVERVDTELVSGDAIATVSSACERLGFHGVYVTDHPAPDQRWLDGGGHHALEPTVALAVAAAATRRVRLHTNIYVLAYRNPFLAAKALASLDVVSDGRLVVGVAAGYLRPEFRALGVDHDRRGELLEQSLELLPRIWSGEVVEASGEGWQARAVAPRPLPVQRPHPPLWIGGNSVAAMSRAARLGQGWSPFPTPGGLERAVRTAAIADHVELERRLERFRELCDEQGRTDQPAICFVPFSLVDYLADPVGARRRLVEEVEQLHALGVDWVALSLPGSHPAEVVDHAAALATDLGLRRAAD